MLTDYMQRRMGLKNGTIEKDPPKAKTALNKNSRKMKVVKVELRKEYPDFLEKNPVCNIQSPVCTYHATCVNHTRGRGANTLNQEDWEPSCWACNTWIEENHKIAALAGHKKSRHSKINH